MGKKADRSKDDTQSAATFQTVQSGHDAGATQDESTSAEESAPASPPPQPNPKPDEDTPASAGTGDTSVPSVQPAAPTYFIVKSAIKTGGKLYVAGEHILVTALNEADTAALLKRGYIEPPGA